MLEPDPVTRELTLVALHPGITVEQVKAATGWDLRISPNLAMTREPTGPELAALRDLHEKTAKAHGTSAVSE